ncbi:type IV toxin-antitoxin system AbiEi family antitoxin [Hymenobacter seoulensis]
MATVSLLTQVREKLAHTLGVPIRVQEAADVASEVEQHWFWEPSVAFHVRACSCLSAHQIARYAHQHPRQLLVTEFVSAEIGEQLRAARICYADSAGNAWLCCAQPQVLVHLQGNPPHRAATAPVSASIVATQMRFAFQLITGPQPYAHTAEALSSISGIKLALVERFISNLQHQGLWHLDDQHRLDSLPQLAQAWQKQYATSLRNRLNPQRYRWRDPAMATKMLESQALPAGSWWSGEVAAGQLLGQPVSPTAYILYTRQPRPNLAERMGLIPHSKGNVEVLNPFFSDVPLSAAYGQCVDPFLIHSDLLLSESSVSQAMATALRRQFLPKLL